MIYWKQRISRNNGKRKIISELSFAVRSSGAGGQNVNKVSSKVVLTFDLKNSQALNEEEKLWLKPS
jgi:ribosome-associated protein